MVDNDTDSGWMRIHQEQMLVQHPSDADNCLASKVLRLSEGMESLELPRLPLELGPGTHHHLAQFQLPLILVSSLNLQAFRYQPGRIMAWKMKYKLAS